VYYVGIFILYILNYDVKYANYVNLDMHQFENDLLQSEPVKVSIYHRLNIGTYICITLV
jgi:hypothetical protein